MIQFFSIAHFSLPLRRHPGFDEKFFGPRNTNIRHIAVKTNTHLSMPVEPDDPVRYLFDIKLPCPVLTGSLRTYKYGDRKIMLF